jgi:hypothetical protein
MPKKHVRDDGHSKKSNKSDSTSRETYHFNHGSDIQSSLQNQKHDGLTDGESFASYTEEYLANVCFLAVLASLRNQLTIKYGEDPIQPDDHRLALVGSWLEIAPGAQSIFSIWESATEV